VHYACHKGNIEIFEYLLKNGGNIHLPSKNGVTCLHLAAAQNQLDMTRYLVESKGFAPNVSTTSSQSQPIHVAARSGNLEIVKYLVEEKKVDVTVKDKNFEDALTLSIKRKHAKLAIYLIELEVFDLTDCNERTGFNYFCYAVAKGCKSVATVIFTSLQI
jgi:ankyrin repeat protein